MEVDILKPQNNLFYPFSQPENQATKALINTLELLDDSYTALFIEYVTNHKTESNGFTYTLQSLIKDRDLEDKNARNYLLCIANSTETIADSSGKISSIPDGGIFTKIANKPVNIAIETKIGEGKLSQDQINRHLMWFGSNPAEVLKVTWDTVREFFKAIDTADKLTEVLVGQFEQFCLIYSLGTHERNRGYWLTQFHDYYDIAYELDHFLTLELGYQVYEQKAKDYGINYNKKKNSGQNRFAKLHVSGNSYRLILHYRDKNNPEMAHSVRAEYNLAPILTKKQNIEGYQGTHEVWIPLEWIRSGAIQMDVVKELCKKAYEVTYGIETKGTA